MGKVIKITLDNKSYSIEFNRRTLILASEIDNEKLSNYDKIVELVRIGLLKNHPTIKREEVVELIEEIGDLDQFVDAISKVMEASVNALKEKKGNAKWEVN